MLKFENEEEEEEEEKDSWQIRLERFQDEESMMIMDRVIQDGVKSFGLNINTHDTLSKRMENDRELLKQGNPRTKHEVEKHHESDEFASKMLSRREQIDRELRKDVELMETHGDSLVRLRKHTEEEKKRVERIKELRNRTSELFEQTQKQSNSVRLAHESFLQLKKRIRARLETPLTRSLLNSEVRERENMSRKLKRDKRRSRCRDEFHIPLNEMSRDLDQTCIESQKNTNKEGAIRLERIVRCRKMIAERFKKWSQDRTRLQSMESKIENLSRTLRDRAKNMDIDSEACETDMVSLETDSKEQTQTWGKYPGRGEQQRIENHDTEFVSSMESKFTKLNASHQAERESLNKEREELKEERREWNDVRSHLSHS